MFMKLSKRKNKMRRLRKLNSKRILMKNKEHWRLRKTLKNILDESRERLFKYNDFLNEGENDGPLYSNQRSQN